MIDGINTLFLLIPLLLILNQNHKSVIQTINYDKQESNDLCK